MSIVTSMISIVREQMEQSGAVRLRGIKIKVGEMASVEPDSLIFCFAACTEGTDMEGAILDIEEVPLTGLCVKCRKEFRMERYFATPCPECGGTAGNYLSGLELDMVSMEVD